MSIKFWSNFGDIFLTELSLSWNCFNLCTRQYKAKCHSLELEKAYITFFPICIDPQTCYERLWQLGCLKMGKKGIEMIQAEFASNSPRQSLALLIENALCKAWEGVCSSTLARSFHIPAMRYGPMENANDTANTLV